MSAPISLLNLKQKHKETFAQALTEAILLAFKRTEHTLFPSLCGGVIKSSPYPVGPLGIHAVKQVSCVYKL